MAFAILRGTDWVELVVGEDVVVGDGVASYETVTIWSSQQRTAKGIKVIVDDAIPAGKVATGSTLVDDDGAPRRQWVLADIPADVLQQRIIEECRVYAQQRLDNFAATRGYDGILSAATYASSLVPQFAAEGQYCVDIRDQTWAALFQLMADVQGGTEPMPATAADIEPYLPVLEWPE